jgi:hypothetical protein
VHDAVAMRRRRRPPSPAAPAVDVAASLDYERRPRRRRTAPGDVDLQVAAIAAMQEGLVTRADLLALSLTGSAIGARVAAGRLHIVFRGVYSVGHPPLTERARLRSALLAVGPRAALSHRTAAAHRELGERTDDIIDVVVFGTPPRSRPGICVHRTQRPFEVTYHDVLPVTSPLRTLEDLRGEPDLPRMCGEALVRKLVTQRELDAAGLTHPDVAPTPGAFGRRFHALLRRAGLPRPAAELQIGRYTADFAWPEEKVIVETDGYGAHGHRAAFEHDRVRDAYLLARGWVVMRVTWRRLGGEPLRVVAELAQILAVRRAA